MVLKLSDQKEGEKGPEGLEREGYSRQRGERVKVSEPEPSFEGLGNGRKVTAGRKDGAGGRPDVFGKAVGDERQATGHVWRLLQVVLIPLKRSLKRILNRLT